MRDEHTLARAWMSASSADTSPDAVALHMATPGQPLTWGNGRAGPHVLARARAQEPIQETGIDGSRRHVDQHCRGKRTVAPGRPAARRVHTCQHTLAWFAVRNQPTYTGSITAARRVETPNGSDARANDGKVDGVANAAYSGPVGGVTKKLYSRLPDAVDLGSLTHISHGQIVRRSQAAPVHADTHTRRPRRPRQIWSRQRCPRSVTLPACPPLGARRHP
jgi:hypothetical protein